MSDSGTSKHAEGGIEEGREAVIATSTVVNDEGLPQEEIEVHAPSTADDEAIDPQHEPPEETQPHHAQSNETVPDSTG